MEIDTMKISSEEVSINCCMAWLGQNNSQVDHNNSISTSMWQRPSEYA